MNRTTLGLSIAAGVLVASCGPTLPCDPATDAACGEARAPAPSPNDTNPPSQRAPNAPSCDPACAAGESCVDGACQAAPVNCASGCVDERGSCQPGDTASQCGQGGLCVACAAGQHCQSGQCAGTPAAVSYRHDVQPIWEARCSSCHIQASAGGLSLSASRSYAELVDAPSSCDDGVMRVRPGDAKGSQLWRKLAGDSARCGGVMPPGNALKGLAPADFARVEAWINAGAPNN